MSVKRFYCEYDDKEAWMGNADSAPADATLYVLASDYDALQSQVDALQSKLDQIVALGVDPVARDKGANFIACRMLAIAGSSPATSGKPK